MVPSINRRKILYGLTCFLPGVVGCAAYQFGNRTLYATNVRTIYVPLFQCDSFRMTPALDIGERLTESVCKEIEKRTPFKVVDSAGADSILTGRIVADTKRMMVESPTDQSRMVEMNLQVLVTWADRGGAGRAGQRGRGRARAGPPRTRSPRFVRARGKRRPFPV